MVAMMSACVRATFHMRNSSIWPLKYAPRGLPPMVSMVRTVASMPPPAGIFCAPCTPAMKLPLTYRVTAVWS